MKKVTAICAALMLVIGVSASNNLPGPGTELSAFFNAANAKALDVKDVDKVVTATFREKFSEAKQVKWSKLQDFYFARFKMNGNSYITAFADDGSYVAISRLIPLSQVPIAASQAITKRYSNMELPDNVTEICLEGDTNYYFKVDNGKHILMLRCTPNGNVTVFSKTKKKKLVGSVY